MPVIWSLDELRGGINLFDAEVTLEQEPDSPNSEDSKSLDIKYTIITPKIYLVFPGKRYDLGRKIQRQMLTHYVSRIDLDTINRRNLNPWINESPFEVFKPEALDLSLEEKKVYVSLKPERHYDEENWYPAVTGPDLLNLRILQILYETKNTLGNLPQKLTKVEKQRELLYENNGGEFCSNLEKELTKKETLRLKGLNSSACKQASF